MTQERPLSSEQTLSPKDPFRTTPPVSWSIPPRGLDRRTCWEFIEDLATIALTAAARKTRQPIPSEQAANSLEPK